MDKYEKPDLSVLNNDGNGVRPEPRTLIIGPFVLVAGIAFIAIVAGGVWSVAGAVQLYAAVQGVQVTQVVTSK